MILQACRTIIIIAIFLWMSGCSGKHAPDTVSPNIYLIDVSMPSSLTAYGGVGSVGRLVDSANIAGFYIDNQCVILVLREDLRLIAVKLDDIEVKHDQEKKALSVMCKACQFQWNVRSTGKPIGADGRLIVNIQYYGSGGTKRDLAAEIRSELHGFN